MLLSLSPPPSPLPQRKEETKSCLKTEKNKENMKNEERLSLEGSNPPPSPHAPTPNSSTPSSGFKTKRATRCKKKGRCLPQLCGGSSSHGRSASTSWGYLVWPIPVMILHVVRDLATGLITVFDASQCGCRITLSVVVTREDGGTLRASAMVFRLSGGASRATAMLLRALAVPVELVVAQLRGRENSAKHNLQTLTERLHSPVISRPRRSILLVAQHLPYVARRSFQSYRNQSLHRGSALAPVFRMRPAFLPHLAFFLFSLCTACSSQPSICLGCFSSSSCCYCLLFLPLPLEHHISLSHLFSSQVLPPSSDGSRR